MLKLENNKPLDAKFGPIQGVMIRSNDLNISYCNSVKVTKIDNKMMAEIDGAGNVADFRGDHVWLVYMRLPGSEITELKVDRWRNAVIKEATLCPSEHENESLKAIVSYNNRTNFMAVGNDIQLVRLTVKQVINVCNDSGVEVPAHYLEALEYMNDVGMNGGYLESVNDHKNGAARKEIEKSRSELTSVQAAFLDEYFELCNKHGVHLNQKVVPFEKRGGEHRIRDGIRRAMLSGCRSIAPAEIAAMVEKISMERMLDKKPKPVEEKKTTTRRL